jgi:bzd-type benzoyl-CoA reductase Q subunit
MATKIDYSKWGETFWHAPGKDWKKAKDITGGVDVGSVSSKAAILCDGELLAYTCLRTGSSSPDSAWKAMNKALEEAKMALENVKFVVGTGYGRTNVPFANKIITEIACHARGANFLCGPKVRTILDMGGQDCKAIHCDEHGKVTNFLMNDKCAAGTGRGMEVLGELMSVPVDQIGPLSLDVNREVPAVSTTCVVFAKSEAVGLMRSGWSRNEVLAAYCESMAHRVSGLLLRIGVEPEFVVTGGIAKNIGIVSRVEKELNIKALKVPSDPQIVGALGAALFARDLWKKSQGQ